MSTFLERSLCTLADPKLPGKPNFLILILRLKVETIMYWF